MTDFFQSGSITTLPRLGGRHLEELERDLRRQCRRQRTTLILPALCSEFDGPAMPGIIEQLRGADYLHGVILSLDRADETRLAEVKEIMAALPVPVKVIWNDGPGIRRLLARLRSDGIDPGPQGKGRGVWLALGYAFADPDPDAIVLHDCDILTYDRTLLARLVCPLVHPEARFEFAKGYYARANGRLNGRVTRLFFTPLVRAALRVLPESRFLRFLDSFRYPLSGEFGFRRDLARQVRMAPDYGLEVSMLEEVFEYSTEHRICQVEIADEYDHKHQDLGENGDGLHGMAATIAAHLLRALARRGTVLSEARFDTLLEAYRHEARQAIRRYEAVAAANGLEHDVKAEQDAVATFVDSLGRQHPEREVAESARLPSWNRLAGRLPEIVAELPVIVRRDSRPVTTLPAPSPARRAAPAPAPSGDRQDAENPGGPGRSELRVEHEERGRRRAWKALHCKRKKYRDDAPPAGYTVRC